MSPPVASAASPSVARPDSRLPVTYVLPIKAASPVSELADYLAWLSRLVEVVVVDGSEPEVFAVHRRLWRGVTHVPVDPDLVSPMGKVGGVLTGVRLASHRAVVIADDDVRYDRAALATMAHLLDDAEVVLPQNHFSELPWHARWDTARSLIARATGGDWPGTLGVDRDALRASGGYRGDVMFENLELVRTVTARGGRVHDAPDLFVPRVPPDATQFRRQRVRQAYDELARPGRLLVELALLPTVVLGRWRAAVVILAGGAALAEIGRRRGRGRDVFPATAALWAPLWIAERAGTVWLAVGQRLSGGVRYGGGVLRDAASTSGALRARYAGTTDAVACRRQAR